MQNNQTQGFPLDQIFTQIGSKKNIYYGIASKTHKVDDETAKKIIDAELEIYLSRLQEYWDDPIQHKRGNPTLTVNQGVNIFLEVVQSGLSFSKTAKHVYLSRLKGTGSAVGYQVTADGLVYQCQKAEAIDHLSEPVLVQKGEQFSIKNTSDGKHVAEHVAKFDGRPAFNFDNLLVGYIYIVYPNGDRELSWIDANRLDQYRQKSVNKNMYNDASFIQTKVIKHALRKVRKTDFMMQLQADDDEVVQNNMEWPDQEPAQGNAPAQKGFPPVQAAGQSSGAGAFYQNPWGITPQAEKQTEAPTKGSGSSFSPAPASSPQGGGWSNAGVGDEPF